MSDENKQTMSEQQNAMIVFAEECGEVATELLALQKQIFKAVRFGVDEQRDLPTTNKERIEAEWQDLLGSIAHLELRGFNFEFDMTSVLKKSEKIAKYENYSKDLGVITND